MRNKIRNKSAAIFTAMDNVFVEMSGYHIEKDAANKLRKWLKNPVMLASSFRSTRRRDARFKYYTKKREDTALHMAAGLACRGKHYRETIGGLGVRGKSFYDALGAAFTAALNGYKPMRLKGLRAQRFVFCETSNPKNKNRFVHLWGDVSFFTDEDGRFISWAPVDTYDQVRESGVLLPLDDVFMQRTIEVNSRFLEGRRHLMLYDFIRATIDKRRPENAEIGLSPNGSRYDKTWVFSNNAHSSTNTAHSYYEGEEWDNGDGTKDVIVDTVNTWEPYTWEDQDGNEVEMEYPQCVAYFKRVRAW